jgi:phosphatidylglycerol:prolipoprotein diacylglycerol transferase
MYAVARFAVEFTRQPDAQLGLVIGPFSMGQLLSVGVLAGAAAIYWWPSRNSAPAPSLEGPPAAL